MMITRDRKWLGEAGIEKLLTGAMREFQQGQYRLERLARYRQGKSDIMVRERPEGLPNTRMSHGFARYISQVSAGYLLSQPVHYQDDERPEGVKALCALYARAGAEQADTQLAMAQASFGRAVSLTYQSAAGHMKVACLDPRSAFVVYDDTVEHKPLMGVLMSLERDALGETKGGNATVYLPGRCLNWRLTGGFEPAGQVQEIAQPFSHVPMVEYLNNEEAHSDFEEVMPLIDAYDLLGSDRVNDRAQFADALLVLTGVIGIGTRENPTDHRAGIRKLRQDRTLSLPDSDAKAEWLVKNPAEKDIDVLRLALAADIHKFSMTPDFADERFAGNISGVAIRYKLFCLDQKTRLKERWFTVGLRERARLAAEWMAKNGLPPVDADELTISLRRQLPQDQTNQTQMKMEER
ncbi:MAG: phage portal protein [Clostridiales bacterium]|nr:phage portal protein [Clostridiales bacterium]